MNVSKKVLVIIYMIFALLTSVALFSSYAITYLGYSFLENNQNEADIYNVEHILDLQTEQLDQANCFLSTREDIRAFMRTQDPEVLNETGFLSGLSVLGGQPTVTNTYASIAASSSINDSLAKLFPVAARHLYAPCRSGEFEPTD
jgi:hypothetical protein